MSSHVICSLNELPEYGSIGLELNGEDYFAVRQGPDVYVYLNKCPHLGLQLNLMPDQFLDYDKHYIQCTSHGALFTIDTGLCVAGPCPNKSLEALPCKVENGNVLLTDYPLTQ
ncbi:MAG: Rieske (2Fe-2S) protein [Porticoccus sp.]|nr:Rieske (2Fe-2S) protein [Porticoccus sp.]